MYFKILLIYPNYKSFDFFFFTFISGDSNCSGHFTGLGLI